MFKTICTYIGITISAILVLTACDTHKEPLQVSLQGQTMGTTYTIKYIASPSQALPSPETVKAAIDTQLVEVNKEMSTYDKTSVISQFNQLRLVDEPYAIPSDFAIVVKEAIRLNKVTDGALDITVGPLVNLWGFGPDKRVERVPTAEQIAERAVYVGIDKLVLHDEAGKTSLSKKIPELYIDLSSIAKGFGVDKVAHYLDSLGIENYLVEIGGELRARGVNVYQKTWSIGIEQPKVAAGKEVSVSQLVVPLANLAMATSGDYRNFRVDEQGRRLSHIIHPQDKAPISHDLASITVIHPSAMTADGLSTGLYVLGEQRALEVAERENLAVFLIIKTSTGFETKMSSAFKALLK